MSVSIFLVKIVNRFIFSILSILCHFSLKAGEHSTPESGCMTELRSGNTDDNFFFISIHVCFGGKKQKKICQKQRGKESKNSLWTRHFVTQIIGSKCGGFLLETLKVSISLSWRPAAVIKAIFELKAVGEGEDKTYLFQVWNRQLSLPYQGFPVL